MPKKIPELERTNKAVKKTKKVVAKKIKDSFFEIGKYYRFYFSGGNNAISGELLKANKLEFLILILGEKKTYIINKNLIETAIPLDD